MKPLKLGIIGGSIDSAIGYTHFIASQIDNRFKITAACFSKDNTINEKTSQTWFHSKINLYNSYKDLLENEINNLDAISILTPTPTHKKIVLEALEKNYPVICEKTLCTNLNDAKDIEALLKRKNGFLAITYNYTGYHMVRELKSIIENNEFGEIFNIQIEMPQDGFIRVSNGTLPSPQKWRMKDIDVPILSLDLGVHMHNLIAFLTNKKALSVFGTSNNYSEFKIIDDVNIIAKYEDNLVVNGWYSKVALGYKNGLQIRVFGKNLSAFWIQNNPEELILNTKNGMKIIKDRASPSNIANLKRYNRFKAGHPSGFIEAFGNYYSDVANCIANKKLEGYVFGIKEALEELKFLEALKESCMKNKLIYIRRENES